MVRAIHTYKMQYIFSREEAGLVQYNTVGISVENQELMSVVLT